jgi:MFS family permease
MKVDRAPGWVTWPRRINIALLCFFTLLVAYCDRVNLAVAAPDMMREFQWSTAQMGWVFSGFFAGYTLFILPAGLVVERYGARRVLGYGLIGWSVLTALVTVPRTIPVLSSTRVLLGASESGTFPAINTLLARWFSKEEYARAAGFCWAGGYAASIVAFPLAGAILHLWGWRGIFWAFGGLGLVWSMVWVKGTAKEGEIRNEKRQTAEDSSIPLPILLRSRPVWALLVLHWSSNWFSYVLISWLPTYLEIARHFSIGSTAIGSAMPFLAAWLGTNVFGFAIDRLSLRFPRTKVRKSMLLPFALSGFMLAGVGLLTSYAAIVGLLSLATALMTAATPIYASGSLDLAPNSSARLVGIQSTVANTAGIVAPVVSGYLARNGGWGAVFTVTALVCLLGAVTYGCIGRAEPLQVAVAT